MEQMTVTGKIDCYFSDEEFVRFSLGYASIEEYLKPPATATAIGRFMETSKHERHVFVMPVRRGGKEVSAKWWSEDTQHDR